VKEAFVTVEQKKRITIIHATPKPPRWNKVGDSKDVNGTTTVQPLECKPIINKHIRGFK
jgi:hypothetical protein